MSQIADLHHGAMDLCDQALTARSLGDSVGASALFHKAFEREREAAQLVAPQFDREPTRSVLHRSAATLALDCREYRSAEQLIASALSGNPPEEIADELRDLLEQVNFQRHLSLRGLQLTDDEIQLSISGNSTSHGMALSDVFIDRVQNVEKLLFRTEQRKMNLPFRDAAKPIRKVSRNYELYLSVPRAVSFAVTLKLGVPQKQLKLPIIEQEIIDKPDQIVDDLLTCLGAFDQGNEDALADLIPDDSYRRNFSALAEQLAPDGEQIKVVGLKVVRVGTEHAIALKRKRSEERRRPLPGQARVIEVSGTLRVADFRKDIIVIEDKRGQSHRFLVPQGMMADIVKPLWEEDVIVTGVPRGRKTVLERIVKAIFTTTSSDSQTNASRGVE